MNKNIDKIKLIEDSIKEIEDSIILFRTDPLMATLSRCLMCIIIKHCIGEQLRNLRDLEYVCLNEYSKHNLIDEIAKPIIDDLRSIACDFIEYRSENSVWFYLSLKGQLIRLDCLNKLLEKYKHEKSDIDTYRRSFNK